MDMQFGQSVLNQKKQTKMKIIGTVYNQDVESIIADIKKDTKIPVQEQKEIEQFQPQKNYAKLLQDQAEMAIQRRKEHLFRKKYQL